MMRRRHAALWLAVAVWMCGSPCGLLSVHAATSSKTSSARLSDVFAKGKRALKRGDLAEAQAAFEAVLQRDPTHTHARSLLQDVAVQKARLMARALQEAKREEQGLRVQAMRVAVDVAREKSQQTTAREAKAQRQLASARERQLKELYKQGVAKWRHGARQDAVELFQQMAVIDPRHPLVAEAQRLVAQAKPLDSRRPVAVASAPPPSSVPALEDLLTAKRMEQDVTIKYAKQALQQRRYDYARELLERLLAQDPQHRQAIQLLHQVELAALKSEQEGLERRLAADEQRMLNDVAKAELLPPPPMSAPMSGARLLPIVDDAQDALSRLTTPISFDFQDVALSDVLDFFADAASISLVPSPRLDLKSQRVSLRADRLPLGMALKYVMNAQGLAYRVDEGVILIATPQEFANEPLETRVFYLRSGLGPFALETSALGPNPIAQMQSLKRVIEQAVTQPQGGKFIIDERSGSIIVTNTAENLGRIERLLSQLDTTPVQVLIEARFMEVNVTDLDQLGLESVLTGPAALTKKGAADHTQGPGQQLASGGGFKFPALSTESEARGKEALNLTLQGVLTGTQFEAVLHALKETKHGKTLSAPRVTTLNNQRASIKVVDEFRYPTRYEVSLVQFDINGDGDFEDAGETEFVNVPQDIQKRDVGILLNVTPSVGKDVNTITLVLAPEVSQFSKFRDLGGDVSVPEFTSSQLTTSVVMENGQTAVLGGLMKDTLSEQVDKVPFFGDLPLLGSLFRQREQSQTRTNLLIFVTARILAPRGPTI